jgi:hypothetical protein
MFFCLVEVLGSYGISIRHAGPAHHPLTLSSSLRSSVSPLMRLRSRWRASSTPVPPCPCGRRCHSPCLRERGRRSRTLGQMSAAPPALAQIPTASSAPARPSDTAPSAPAWGHRHCSVHAREVADATPPRPRGHRRCSSVQPPLLHAPSRGHQRWVAPVSPIRKDRGTCLCAEYSLPRITLTKYSVNQTLEKNGSNLL